jgi:hypothetical protein
MKTCRTCNEAKPADAYRGTRSMCLACENARRMERYRANRETEIASMKLRNRTMYERRRDELIAKATEWNKANPNKRNAICKDNMRRQREKLTNGYVRRMLAQSMGLLAADIPQPLVEAQRELLKIKRYIREHSI